MGYLLAQTQELVIHSRNPSGTVDKERYARIAFDYSKSVGVNLFGKRPDLSGLAWITQHNERVIEAPSPTRSATALYLFLHEAAHHKLRHPDSDKKGMDGVHEYEATVEALSILKRHGVELPQKAKNDLVWNIQQGIKKDRRAGVKTVDPRVEKFIQTYGRREVGL